MVLRGGWWMVDGGWWMVNSEWLRGEYTSNDKHQTFT
jgi:hypothetical protein